MFQRWFWMTVCAGVALATVPGCASLPEAARRQLLHSRRLYDAGHFADAETAAGRVIAQHPEAVEIGEAYYLRGLARVRRARTAEARADFRQVLQRSRRKELSARAATALAMTLQEQGAFSEAASYYERALATRGAGSLRAETLYNLGICRQRAGQWPTARRAFERLIREHPASPHTAQANRHAAWPRDHFAIQCGVFGNPANAARLLGQLRGQGFEAYIEPASSSPPDRQAVRVGRFPDYPAARRALRPVRRTVPDAYIVP